MYYFLDEQVYWAYCAFSWRVRHAVTSMTPCARSALQRLRSRGSDINDGMPTVPTPTVTTDSFLKSDKQKLLQENAAEKEGCDIPVYGREISCHLSRSESVGHTNACFREAASPVRKRLLRCSSLARKEAVEVLEPCYKHPPNLRILWLMGNCLWHHRGG